MQRAAGWYHDPVNVGAARFWDGDRWTRQVAWGGTVRDDPTQLTEVVRRDALHDAEVIDDYLADAVRRGVLSGDLAAMLHDDLDKRVPAAPARPAVPPPPDIAADRIVAPGRRPLPAPLTTPLRAPATPATPGSTTPLRPPTTSATPGSTTPETTPPRRSLPEPAAVAPGRVAAWWGAAERAVRTDLALHGIAYLGVLLLFAGVTGLVVFSFGDVDPWVRSLTELMVPAALFLGAWYLSTRDAVFVGRALELLGGAITPIVVAAAFTDGAPVPPDIDGRALPIVQGIGVAAVAIGMAFAVRHRPSSPLRFLVGPVAWLSVGFGAGALRTPVPSGYETAQPQALQLAAVLAAMAATLLVLPRLPDGPLLHGTRQVALPVAAVVFLIELVLAGGEGWPLASSLVVGLAAIVVLETDVRRLPTIVANSLEYGVVGVTALRLAAVTDPAWVAVGTFVVLLALSEYLGHLRPDSATSWIGIAAAGWALLCTVVEPESTIVGFGVLAAWGMWRHLAPADWVPFRDHDGFVPAAGAAVAVVALSRLVDPAAVLVGAAGLVLLVAIAGRLWRPVAADPMWSWFAPLAAGATVLASLGLEWGTSSAEVASASAMSALGLAITALPLAARVWSAAAATAWAVANAAQLVEVPRDVAAVLVAGAGVGLVTASLALARPVWVHLAAVGYATGLAAPAIPEWPGWAATTTVVLLTAGWWATAIVDERSEAPQLGAARRVLVSGHEPGHATPDVVTETWVIAAFALLCVTTTSASAAIDPSITASWVAVVAAVTILVDASIGRLAPWSRTRHRVLEWAVVGGAVFAAMTAVGEAAQNPDDWSAIAATALVLAVVGVTSAPRPAPFLWTAWIGTAVITLLLGDRLGLAREYLDSLFATWGAVALIGGAGVQRVRHGPRPPAQLWSDRSTLAPLCLGTLAFAVGGVSALSAGDVTTVGWTALAMALVTMSVAVLLVLGALTAVAAVLATVAYSLLAPWDPLDRPVTYVPWVLVLLIAAQLTRVRREDHWLTRWDLPSFVTAHAVALYALGLAFDTDTVALTFASVAAVAVCVSVVLRRFEWAIGAAILLLVAGADAGHGWLALVLLIEGVAVTVAGLQRAGVERWTLIGIGAAATLGAWFDLAAWMDVAADTFVLVTAAAGAALCLVAALGTRSARVPLELAGTWVAAAALVSIGAMVVGSAEVERQSGGFTFAAATSVLAGAAALMVPVSGTWMRWVSAGLAATAWVPMVWAAQPSELVATWVGTVASLSVLGIALAAHGVRPEQPWILPAAAYAVATQLLAAVAALAALPDDGSLTLVLLAVSAELIALGVIAGRAGLFVASPATACAAWLVVARDALAGRPNWFTVPIGLTLLVMVGLVRWIRRRRGGAVTRPDLTVLEYVGMTVMVAPPLALTLAGALWNAIVAIIIGVLLALWGAATRVTWRVSFGSASVVVAVVLVIAVPLSSAVTWTGPSLWLTLTLLGITAIVVATTLERSRDAVRQVGRRLEAMTEGWERVPWSRHGSGTVAHPADPRAESEPGTDHQPIG